MGQPLPLVAGPTLQNPLDAVLAFDDPNRIGKLSNDWIAFIPLPMAFQSLKNVYPRPGSLYLGGLLRFEFVSFGYSF
jgi:hypothetical protein